MKEKKTEIGVNVSSGAEKVETVEKEIKRTAKSTAAKAAQENQAAKERVKTALKKKEKQVKSAAEKAKEKQQKAAERMKKKKQRLEARKALQEKRRAQRLALQEKRREERKALEEKRKAEREEKIRERAHAKANRKQQRSRAKSQREQKKNKGGRENRNSYGGWIAAVVTLGVTTLALTTAVTLGAMEMNKTKEGVSSGYRSTTYELMGIMEHMDDDLDRVRIAATPQQQGRILTDLLVQTRMAELDLEKLPISAETDKNVTTYVNRVARECERMLAKLRGGETLDEKDMQQLQHFYELNHEMRTQLDTIVNQITEKDASMFLKKGEGMISEVLNKLEELTMPENREMQGAGMERTAPIPEAEKQAKIDTAQVEELCKTYFSDYKITDFQCVGETVSRGVKAYNVQGYDENGTMLFAEIDYRSGALVRFDYFEDCSDETFDFENSKRIAEQFLEKLGYENMRAMRLRENGTDADFTFVYTIDDVAFYPDTIKIKVCRTRGVVTGFDASKYLKNHKQRQEPSVSISLEKARSELHEGLEVESARLTVVQTLRGERAAYEFLCSYGEEKYLIYTDAITGAEISIMNIKNVG